MKCPVCFGESSKLGTITRFTEPLYISICNFCGSRFQDPFPQNPDDFYDEGYYRGTSNFSYVDERKSWQFDRYVHRSRLKTIRKFIKGGRFLDIGCSFGGFALSASEWFESYGIDVSSYAIENGSSFVKKMNPYPPKLFIADIINKEQIDYCFGENFFDVITMIEVAEHLEKPFETFTAIANRMRKGALLVIQTANFEGWQARNAGLNYHYFLPGHLIYYTATGLKSLLQKTGFKTFREYIPVDFSMFAKICKSRGGFQKLSDYKRWFEIIRYHLKSKSFLKDFPRTSSYVLYAFRD